MPIFSSLMFRAARRGLREEEGFFSDAKKAGSWAHRGARRDLCVLVFASEGVRVLSEGLHPARHKGRAGFGRLRWPYARFHGSSSAHSPRGVAALPELGVAREKQRVVIRTAQRFLAERRTPESPYRFNVEAIDNKPGQPSVVRQHKDAFSPQMQRWFPGTPSR
jgi:hypothetical protein